MFWKEQEVHQNEGVEGAHAEDMFTTEPVTKKKPLRVTTNDTVGEGGGGEQA